MRVRGTGTQLRHGRRWPWAVPVLALLAVPLATNIGGASIPDGSGVIHACYGDDGQLRVIDTATIDRNCKALEEPLSWGEKGPKGDPGDGAEGLAVIGAATATFAAGTEHNVVRRSTTEAGTYVVFAKTTITADPDSTSRCELNFDPDVGAATVDESRHTAGVQAGQQSHATHNLQRLLVGIPEPADLSLNCDASKAWSAKNSSIVAIRLAGGTEDIMP